MSTGVLDSSFASWAGKVNEHGIKAVRLVAIRPTPVYETECISCGTSTRTSHSKMSYVTCRNSACGKPERKPSKLDAARAAAKEHERQVHENGLRLAELRMQDDTENYAMPTRALPVTDGHVIMTERDRISIRENREAEEAEARAAQERRDAPIRAIEAQMNATAQKIAEKQRELLLSPSMKDVDLYVDELVDGASMSVPKMKEHNAYHYGLFREEHPEFHDSERNLDMLAHYWQRHGIFIVTFRMIDRLYKRFLEAGIVFDKKPVTVEKPKPGDYSKMPNVELRISEPTKPAPILYDGYDDDGNPCQYTEKQIDRMSSEEMRKRLQMVVRGTLLLPRIGPGPRGRSY